MHLQFSMVLDSELTLAGFVSYYVKWLHQGHNKVDFRFHV